MFATNICNKSTTNLFNVIYSSNKIDQETNRTTDSNDIAFPILFKPQLEQYKSVQRGIHLV